jgi:hypothetical protein
MKTTNAQMVAQISKQNEEKQLNSIYKDIHNSAELGFYYTIIDCEIYVNLLNTLYKEGFIINHINKDKIRISWENISETQIILY